MADSDPHIEPGGGIRRRYSAQQDASEHPQHSSDQPRHQRSSSSSIDVPTVPQSLPPIDTSTRTVRFSADVDRNALPSALRSPTSQTASANSPHRIGGQPEQRSMESG